LDLYKGAGKRVKMPTRKHIGFVITLFIVMFIMANVVSLSAMPQSISFATELPTVIQLQTGLHEYVEAQLRPFEGKLQQVNCAGDHGAALKVYDTYNEQLERALEWLLSRPSAKSLSTETLVTIFGIETGRPVELFAGNDDSMFAVLTPARCPVGSHDTPIFPIYIMDNDGHLQLIAAVNRVLSAEWSESRWVSLVDVPLIGVHGYQIWHVTQQDHQWNISYKLPIRDNWAENVTIALEGNFRTLEVQLQPLRDYSGPCEAIASRKDFYFTWYIVTRTYQWSDDAYQQTSETKSPSHVVLKGDKAPTPPYYIVKDWQSLCPHP
jgi:hypothetical protein